MQQGCPTTDEALLDAWLKVAASREHGPDGVHGRVAAVGVHELGIFFPSKILGIF